MQLNCKDTRIMVEPVPQGVVVEHRWPGLEAAVAAQRWRRGEEMDRRGRRDSNSNNSFVLLNQSDHKCLA